ncbi:MAG: alkaline phosphatase D family protein, partial [Acidobacteria bacterium]|nr:alkaline phosphatase D family protein [Acidobacteriota bacterium]
MIFLINSTILWSETTIAVPKALMQTHGQASGDVTDSSAIIWTRVSRAARVFVEVALNPSFTSSRTTEPILVGAETDFTAKIEVTGLEPGQRYYYRVILEDLSRLPGSLGPPGTFVTAPPSDQAAPFTFAWSGDSWAALRPFRIFTAMQEQQPDFFLYLGDTIYADLSAPPAKTIEQYRRAYKVNRRDESLRTFLDASSVYVIWDDHEVQNDFDSTNPRIPIGRQAFLEYWPIRANAKDPTRLYRSFRWGQAAELFILDTRQYRRPSSLPDTSSKTMLGAQQKAGLKAALHNSTAKFKFIATSVPLRVHGRDSWEGYTIERQELFDFIIQNNIKNVIFLSADAHYAAVINHPEGFKEVIIGPIAQI